MKPIFLDHASTTPIDPTVATAMSEVLTGALGIGNASSDTHAYGRDAASAIEAARADVAALIGARAEDLIFTSGATESDNLAIVGVARGRADRGRHLVTSRTEHKAVLDPVHQLEKRGWQVSELEPGRDGRIDSATVAAALRPDTQLVSIMHANNETGVVQDIAAIAAVCRARDVFLHCDAAQSVGRLPIDVESLGVDLLSISAHKLYGPKGIGALWVSPRVRPWVEPLMWGGGHERGLRPGTLATHQIIGFGRAAARVREQRDSDARHVEALASRFRSGLAGVEGLRWNDHPVHRLPGLLSLSIEGVEGESLIAALPTIAVSSGAACDSTSGEPSYVLRAQGVPTELAQSTLRVAFGRFNTETEAIHASTVVREAVARLRAQDAPGSPAGEGWGMGEAGSLREGARIRCFVRLDTKQNITAIEFRAATCPGVWTVLDGLKRELVGRPAATPTLGGPRDWVRRFNLPTEKLGRLFRVEDALGAALKSAGEP
ncbi:MAG: aminotransferase class V-fold PLP-dependent enzyme [Gammaproteobacteria bacterium]|nr:aminotransferase class V-fold PLP-dependent enzyme [Gammaproteobacteria bacterium]